MRVSDLRGYGVQLNLGISRDVFRFNNRYQVFGSLSYTLQATRRQFRGFDGASFGDPRTIEWSAGPSDARHAVAFSTGLYAPKAAVVTLFPRPHNDPPSTPVLPRHL